MTLPEKIKAFGLDWENIQPIVWVAVAALLTFLPDGDAKMMLVGAALTRIRKKL
jgi:hypothetical protein